MEFSETSAGRKILTDFSQEEKNYKSDFSNFLQEFQVVIYSHPS